MMPLHRRHTSARHDHDHDHDENDTTTGEGSNRIPEMGSDPDDNHDGKSGMAGRSTSISSSKNQQRTLIIACLVVLQIILLTTAAMKTKVTSIRHLIAVLLAAFISSLPAFLMLGVGLGVVGTSTTDLPHQRYIPLTVAATIVGNQLPVFLSAGMTAVGILLFGLASRPIPPDEDEEPSNHKKNKKDDDDNTTTIGKSSNSSSGGTDMSGPLKTVLATFLMIAVLLTDNFFVWVVAATYKPGQALAVGDLPTPLQDNGQIVMNYLFRNVLTLSKRDVVTVRGMINVEWLLVAGLGLSLVALEMQGPAMRRSLWSVARRGVLTLTGARSIRIVSFLITVLPSQNPHCYFGHYPFPPPQEWVPWLMVGLAPQVNGGCNDLIISGHATVTSTIACIVTSVVGKPLFTAALWMFVAMDYMVEVYEGFHYSVDMFLGALMVNFVWAVLAHLEESDGNKQGGGVGVGISAKRFYTLQDANQSDLIKYLIPALGAYLQVVGFIPQDAGNYTIVAYIMAVAYQLYRFGFQQYTQHTLFCLLYLALGIYL